MKTLLIYDSDILPIKGLDNFDDIFGMAVFIC